MATPTGTSEVTALDAARNAFRNMMAHVQYVVDGDDDPEKAMLARVHNVSARADQDSKVAARMALVSIAEDLHRIADHLAVERIHRSNGDWLVCVCRNTPDQSGFAPCLPDGTEVEPVAGGQWGGLLYVCLDCGRIVNQDTLEVAGRRVSP